MKLNDETGLDIGAPQERRPTMGTGRGQEQRRSHTAAIVEGSAHGARRPNCAGGPRGQTIVFDIETGPLSDAELAAALPPFDPNEVKVGNIKDPEKIAAKLAEAEANHRHDFVEKAALDAMTGRVLAIGMLYLFNGEFVVIEHADEAQLLREFWVRCEHEMGRLCADKGWNALPITVVERTAADVMLDVWQAAKSHCVEREGKKSNRGWKKVRLKSVPVAN